MISELVAYLKGDHLIRFSSLDLYSMCSCICSDFCSLKVPAPACGFLCDIRLLIEGFVSGYFLQLSFRILSVKWKNVFLLIFFWKNLDVGLNEGN